MNWSWENLFNFLGGSDELFFFFFFSSLTSTLADLSVASPEDSDKGGSVMRSGPDVVVLSEEDVVTVLHTAETTNKETESAR